LEVEAFLSEYVQFGLAMALMIALLLGSYWFVLSPSRGEKQQAKESERQAD
jgi:hypothetical protein